MPQPIDEPAYWQATHDAAHDQGDDGYIDPHTGLFVMTRGYLQRRGHCCETGCRHCPYDFSSEPETP